MSMFYPDKHFKNIGIFHMEEEIADIFFSDNTDYQWKCYYHHALHFTFGSIMYCVCTHARTRTCIYIYKGIEHWGGQNYR